MPLYASGPRRLGVRRGCCNVHTYTSLLLLPSSLVGRFSHSLGFVRMCMCCRSLGIVSACTNQNNLTFYQIATSTPHQSDKPQPCNRLAHLRPISTATINSTHMQHDRNDGHCFQDRTDTWMCTCICRNALVAVCRIGIAAP